MNSKIKQILPYKTVKIKFKLKSFQKHIFKEILPKILRKIQSLSIITTGFIGLPKKIQRYTVLRSPHIHKKSREQFESKIYSQLLITSFNFNCIIDKQKAKLLINFIKNSGSGLNVKITYII